MRMSFALVYLITTFTLLGAKPPEKGIEYVITDIDETLLRSTRYLTTEELEKLSPKQVASFFDTNFFIYRLSEAPIPFKRELLKAEKEILEISPYDFYRLSGEGLLATGQGGPGRQSEVTLLDGRVIRPGIYQIKGPESYNHYRANNDEYILRKFQQAESLSKRTWKGPSLAEINWIQKNSEVRIEAATARGGSLTELINQYWVEKGYLHRPLDHIEYFSSYGRANRTTGESIAVRKALFMRSKAEILSRVPGNHILHFYEDDDKYLAALVKEARTLVNSSVAENIRFIFHKVVPKVTIPLQVIEGESGTLTETRYVLEPLIFKISKANMGEKEYKLHWTEVIAGPDNSEKKKFVKKLFQKGQLPLGKDSCRYLLSKRTQIDFNS